MDLVESKVGVEAFACFVNIKIDVFKKISADILKHLEEWNLLFLVFSKVQLLVVHDIVVEKAASQAALIDPYLNKLISTVLRTIRFPN